MICVGLMSGTSADGVDAALVEIVEPSPPRLLCFLTHPISDETRAEIFDCSRSADTQSICRLNFQLGELFAQAALAVIHKAGLTPEQVELIGSHGQTISHLPPQPGTPGSTLQIGEPSVIAHKSGIKTIADFRTADMAVGGQGAPLLPILHHRLFAEQGKNTGVVNIGGIANVTYLPGSMKEDQVLAFDTGPGNMVIDALSQIFYQRAYDEGGSHAAQGESDPALLDELMQHPYLGKTPPKSTGREEFGHILVQKIAGSAQGASEIEKNNILHTVTEFTARSIAQGCREFLPGDLDRLWVCGGGVGNVLLMGFLQKEFSPVPLESTASAGVDPDALEAMGFAYLAYRTINGLPGNMPSVTGAAKTVVLGKITG